jgi:4-hydroxybenzoate polyprenyltransferase
MNQKGFFESSIILLKSRIGITLSCTWFGSLASIIAGKGFPPILDSFLSIVALAMVVTSVYVYNDIIDREMDAHSSNPAKKKRPIAHGVVPVKNAMRFVYLSGILGLGLCLYLGPLVFSVAFIYYVLIFLYSYPPVRFKKMFVIKTIVTCFLLPACFMIPAVAVEKTISTNIIILATLWYIFSFLISPVLTDILDAEEDLAFNIRTIGNTLSWKQNLILFNLGIITLWSTSIIANLIAGVSYFIPIAYSLVCAPVMILSYKLRNDDEVATAQKLRALGRIYILLNPLLLAIGTLL